MAFCLKSGFGGNLFIKKALFLIILTILMSLSVAALPYTIEKVKVDGIEVNGDRAHLEIGQNVDVEVFAKGNSSEPRDVNIRVWVGGYEYGDLEAVSDLFDIEQGVMYREKLTLSVPDDLEAGDNNYTLHIEIYDSEDKVEKTFALYVEETRHLLKILDVKLDPKISVDAGKKISAIVRVKNVGAKKEEDIKVVFKIPDLGIVDHTFINELVNEESNADEENSASTEKIYLDIPEDTPTGEYNAVVEVIYDNGHEVAKEISKILVNGKSEEEKKLRESTKIEVEDPSKKIEQGQEGVFKISLANDGTEAQLYEIKVVGAKLWAEEIRIEQAFMRLEPKDEKAAYIYIKIKEDAKIGDQSFFVKILTDQTLIREIPLVAEIQPKKTETEVAKEAAKEETETSDGITGNAIRTGESDFSWLKAGFLILILFLVIGGGMLLVRRLKESDEHPLEPQEGKTYY
ncbi:hypothetical protein HY643_00315 [Candidatus Woesearchaeota archaeon]|nr:hypothetical protein [Candidatus Woesearchaeota archaeon]